jgi:hypothetical protein
MRLDKKFLIIVGTIIIGMVLAIIVLGRSFFGGKIVEPAIKSITIANMSNKSDEPVTYNANSI